MSSKMLQFVSTKKAMPAKRSADDRVADFDEIYNVIFVKPTVKVGRIFWKSGDENIINRYGPDGLSKQVIRITKKIVQMQTGFIYHYAFSMIIGLSFIITFYIIVARG